MARRKVTVIGAGNVGATAAQRICEAGLADVVLIDIVEGLPQGKALDLAESAPVVGHDARVIGTNDYADTAGSRHRRRHLRTRAPAGDEPRRPAGQERRHRPVPSSRPRRPSRRTRSSSSSRTRSTRCATSRWRASGFPRERVIGMAGVLDSSRFRTFIAQELGVSVRTPMRSCSAATATRWCRCRATRPSPASRSPSCCRRSASQALCDRTAQRRRRGRRAAQDRVGVLRPGRVGLRDGRVDPLRPEAGPALRRAAQGRVRDARPVRRRAGRARDRGAWSGSSRSR